MGDKPIIFSAAMVRALLDGRKTQTRRLIKRTGLMEWDGKEMRPIPAGYAPGDRLYVREAMHWTDNLRFVADDSVVDFDRMPDGFTAGRAHVSGMFMPRWASRLTLTVTEVRVQRLQDISEADADAEGVQVGPHGGQCFEELWNSLHGADAWDANPWVIALTFTVQHGNIDKIGGGNA